MSKTINPDPQKMLEANSHYKQLDQYAKLYHNSQGELIEKRNRLWFTGSYDLEEDKSELILWCFFESDVMIVKMSYIMKAEEDLEKQVVKSYEDFYIDVMNYHFNN